MRLFPKETDFFEIFDKTSENLTRAAQQLVDLMENFVNVEARAKEIHEIEQDSDMLTHDIMKKLNKTFVTPIDREDLYALASRLDDCIDLIWAVVDRIAVFKIKEPLREAVVMSKDLLLTAEVMHKAISELRQKNYAHVQEHCIEINRLENRIDRSFRDALGRLFEEKQHDPILVIKWKEIYEHLEDCSDRCEDVANVLEAIVLKYA
ncbi:MAG: DUF47 family protein [Nitrospiraceae bacterium]|nr:DUF47 family protein [Nitrospiraceae bacterium]